MSITFYGCISIDGYLSGVNHDLSWLYNSGDSGETSNDSFYETIDVVIMGRNTYDQIIKTTKIREAYPTSINYVLTTRDDLNDSSIVRASGSVSDLVKTFDKKSNVFIVGGGKILHDLLEANLIDKMVLQFAPVVLGDGIPLFYKSDTMKNFELEAVNQYNQFAEIVYKKK